VEFQGVGLCLILKWTNCARRKRIVNKFNCLVRVFQDIKRRANEKNGLNWLDCCRILLHDGIVL